MWNCVIFRHSYFPASISSLWISSESRGPRPKQLTKNTDDLVCDSLRSDEAWWWSHVVKPVRSLFDLWPLINVRAAAGNLCGGWNMSWITVSSPQGGQFCTCKTNNENMGHWVINMMLESIDNQNNSSGYKRQEKHSFFRINVNYVGLLSSSKYYQNLNMAKFSTTWISIQINTF